MRRPGAYFYSGPELFSFFYPRRRDESAAAGNPKHAGIGGHDRFRKAQHRKAAESVAVRVTPIQKLSLSDPLEFPPTQHPKV